MSTYIEPDQAACLEVGGHVRLFALDRARSRLLSLALRARSRSIALHRHRQLTLTFQEIDEGGYQPHDSKSYPEKDEISRAFQLLNVPPLAAFPGDYTSSSSVMWRYGSLNTGYLSNDEFRLAKGPRDNQDKMGRWRDKIEW